MARVDTSAVPEVLVRGDLRLRGRMPWASNATFLVEASLGEETALAIYKPRRGERPLWDFPPGLYRREIAAYELSELLGWGLVPPTVRREGPLGIGSIQLFVEADFEEHYFTLRERPELRGALERLCAFDLVANNADRKSGHCLLGLDGRLRAIDNGLTFHVEPKLRTVIWEFGGQPLAPDLVADLRRLAGRGGPAALAEWLSVEERRALAGRAAALAARGRFPEDPGGLHYPWPLV
jgi:uncharacterized repeat protein (TIGR03843 family)